jgi:pSer/pThr/pTyr-binding forkhead associated (FHA) protein
MSYTLIPTDAGGGPPISLVRPVLVIGRHPECDIRINSAKISRRHCCIALAYDRVLIRDLGSHNGLRVNGRIVEESRLYPSDEVAIGPLIYRVVADAEPAGNADRGNARPLPEAAEPGNPSSTPHPDDPHDIGLVPIDSD